MSKIYKVNHAQRRWDKPDDAPVSTVVTVKESPGREGLVYLTAPKLGCSRDFVCGEDVRITEMQVIRRWLLDEHAQTVLDIELIGEN